MPAQKTSISIDEADLAAAQKFARARGESLSAFLASLIRSHVAEEAKFEAMDRYLTQHAPGFHLTRAARAAIEAEWTAPLKPIRPKRKKKAA